MHHMMQYHPDKVAGVEPALFGTLLDTVRFGITVRALRSTTIGGARSLIAPYTLVHVRAAEPRRANREGGA